MVKHLHITLDDADHERALSVKNERGWTWREFVVRAADALEQTED